MNYYFFIDESGDHGLANIDPAFPVFVLCGILLSDDAYRMLDESFNKIKEDYWNTRRVIFHSRDIRKCEKEFKILLDLELKSRFYKELDTSIMNSDFTVFASIINKEEYIKKYGKLKTDVYEIALSFLVERTVFFLDSLKPSLGTLFFVLEKRGKREDIRLKKHFESLRNKGTYYITPQRLSKYRLKIDFRSKMQNINGLQLADLVAYPIARYAMDEMRANPAFDLIKPKIYSKGAKIYGLKYFP